MPLFKGTSSKSRPRKVIAYITDKNKAAFVSVRNLFEDEDYAKQFEETAQRFCKGKKFDERKYYHFKLSCDRKDKVSPQEAQVFAEELTARLFKDCECVIATHTDTQTVHSHIIVNAVHPLTGKKLHFNDNDYTAMKDEANRLGEEMGFSKLDFRKKSQNNRTTEEQHIILKGGTSWKEDLREVIEEAKRIVTTESEFIAHLKKYGVEVTRSKTEYSYLHPQKKKAIRGQKLGENYTKKEIMNVIGKSGNGATGNTAFDITGKERGTQRTDGQRTVERSVGDIEREMQQLAERAEYAHQGFDLQGERPASGQRLAQEGHGQDGTVSNNGNAGSNTGRAELQRKDKPRIKLNHSDFCK
jgi:hypothetical protein